MKRNNYKDIKVSSITLDHLSRGVYRSSAAVLKELVNNSYDAGATEVRISLNFPYFDFISCVDNGDGMTRNEFERYFVKEGIGSCVKRAGNIETGRFKRPIIGRLGIGMISIGQICNSFFMESHYFENGVGKAFKAHIILLDTEIPKIKDNLKNGKQKEIKVGTWLLDEIEFDKRKKGFRIYSKDVRSTFKKEMKKGLPDDLCKKNINRIPFKQEDLQTRFFDKKKSIQEWKSYLETIWELSILSPLPYFGSSDNFPINISSFNKVEMDENEREDFQRAKEFIEERQKTFLSYNFRIIFEGIDLRRLIILPSERKNDIIPRLYFINFDQIIGNERLKFSGYLFAQIHRAIRPLEITGVQIRLKEVGIGVYDQTFLKFFRKIPTVKERWLSGEIFVDEGLEDALNIDRDSFNEHNEHYKKLKFELHQELNEIFSKISSIADKSQEKKRQRKEKKFKKDLKDIIYKHSNGKYKLLEKALKRDEPIIKVNEEKGEIILNTSSLPSTRKRVKSIIRAVELTYSIAEQIAEDEEERHNIFQDILIQFMEVLL